MCHLHEEQPLFQVLEQPQPVQLQSLLVVED
jgi:hypothetical protein